MRQVHAPSEHVADARQRSVAIASPPAMGQQPRRLVNHHQVIVAVEQRQSFHEVHIEIDEDSLVTLSLKLMGVSVKKDVCDCGRKRKRSERFCSTCGVQLVN